MYLTRSSECETVSLLKRYKLRVDVPGRTAAATAGLTTHTRNTFG
ncbi:hypothetical protein HMPREF0043_01152 [Actinobaculum sp. oral taxon 183 str. F0552]|jgi:hypothetical protein|nr:hypothetical protein HMPREF0043_01152 [Actinobaculum sp. oral taxon 183 str. F0552]